MHDPANAAGAFVLLIAAVGASFVYVSGNPVEVPKEPWLGITGSIITPEIVQQLGLEQQQGFLITEVQAGSPADTAGIMARDVIVAIDDRQIVSEEDITAVLDDKVVGDNISFSIRREGSPQEIAVDVTLGEKPSR